MSDRNNEIIRLRKKGWPPRKIVAHMDLSRNVVLGVLFRAGLCDPDVDRSAHARHGCDHPCSRLTPAEVRKIRKRWVRYDPKHGTSALAAEYGINIGSMSRLLNGHGYRNVK